MDVTDLDNYFRDRITIDENDCWVWGMSLTRDGYAKANFRGLSSTAHRVLWTVYVGTIEPDLQLDHLCRNRACVNPAHLEPVTRAENHRRGAHANKSHCPSGHPYSGSNLMVRIVRGEVKGRACRTCHNAHKKRSWDRKKDSTDAPTLWDAAPVEVNETNQKRGLA